MHRINILLELTDKTKVGGGHKVRVSKLEPHVLGSEPLSSLDEFLDELAEEAASSMPPSSRMQTAESSIDSGKAHEEEVAEGFVRLADFIKKKEKAESKIRDKKAMALAAYRKQVALFAGDEHKQLIPVDEVVLVPLPYHAAA